MCWHWAMCQTIKSYISPTTIFYANSVSVHESGDSLKLLAKILVDAAKKFKISAEWAIMVLFSLLCPLQGWNLWEIEKERDFYFLKASFFEKKNLNFWEVEKRASLRYVCWLVFWAFLLELTQYGKNDNLIPNLGRYFLFFFNVSNLIDEAFFSQKRICRNYLRGLC